MQLRQAFSEVVKLSMGIRHSVIQNGAVGVLFDISGLSYMYESLSMLFISLCCIV